MIGYNRLGSNGRLGNQMFQYASLRGIAANRGFDFSIPPADYQHTANYGLFDCFKMSSAKNVGFIDGPTVTEKTHSFDDGIYNICPDNVNLDGFFQTEKYFKNISDSICSDFSFIDNYLGPCKEFIDQFEVPPIFIHIRRGDSIGREQFHPIQPLSYYEWGLENFDKDIPVLIFTDDIEWCKSQELFQKDRFYFNENQDKFPYKSMDGLGKMQNSLIPYIDLCLMFLCDGAIIANSSLSWWGAWLQKKSEKIIAPTPWFGTSMKHLNTSDIIPDRWIVKEVK